MIKADWFIWWLRGAQWLRAFWAKLMGEAEILYKGEHGFIVWVEWPRARRSSGGLFVYSSEENGLYNLLSMASKWKSSLNGDIIVIAKEGLTLKQLCIDAESIFYIWNIPEARPLEPNFDVDIKVFPETAKEVEKAIKQVMKRSWGFVIMPRRDLHLVISAWLNGEPVGIAYLNKLNFNIDFGVHVVRKLWRKRIGTRLLHEVLRLASARGAERATVVRIYRQLGGSPSDKAATSFYRANNPSMMFSVYRLHA